MEFFKKNGLKIKFGIVYFSLASVLVFSIIFLVMDTQSELISEVAKYKSEKFVNKLIFGISNYSSDLSDDIKSKSDNKLKNFIKFVKTISSRFSIIDLTGKVLYSTTPEFKLPDDFLNISKKAYFEKEFTGNKYSAVFDEKNHTIAYYIPLEKYKFKNILIYVQYNLKNITKYNQFLYKSIILIVIIIFIIVMVISIFIYRYIISPILKLHEGTKKIQENDFSFKIKINRDDELGILINNFNKMSETISTQIDTLNNNIKQINEQKEQLQKMSITDMQTRLYNRKFSIEVLEKEIQRYLRVDTIFSLLLIDIDHFRHINDKYGYDAGDMILIKISKLLKEEYRTIDYIFRYDGNEFMIILPNTDIEGAYLKAEKVRKSIENLSVKYNDSEIDITASFGIIEINSIIIASDDIKYLRDLLISKINIALRYAKETGRNKVIKYTNKLEKNEKSI